VRVKILVMRASLRFLQTTSKHIAWETSNVVEDYCFLPTTPLSLTRLLNLGHSKSVRESAIYLHAELPKRLARRVKSLQSLPFIVGVNPWIKSVYNLYRSSFELLRTIPDITSIESEESFNQTLLDLTESHQNVTVSLAQGFAECNSEYMSKDERTKFLDGMINARIGIRLLAENHLALTQKSDEEWIGIVHKEFKPALLIKRIGNYCHELCNINYGSAPSFVINGNTDAKFPYVPNHVEYILMELMKNCMRATVEHSNKIGRHEHPPVEITIVQGDDDIAIRLRDQGGGIPSSLLPFIFDYSFTTVPKIDDSTDMFSAQATMQVASGGPMAGLGFGLPMSRIYAKYFGGSLDLKSIGGHGVDVFVHLPNIDLRSAIEI